jgi:hypothetical protein
MTLESRLIFWKVGVVDNDDIFVVFHNENQKSLERTKKKETDEQ